MYSCGKDCLILIPFRLRQIGSFTLSLKCFSSDSENCPALEIGPLLQFPHLLRAGPALLALLFFPLVPSSYWVLHCSIILFHWPVTPVCSQLVFCMHFCVWRCILDVSVERDVLHIHLLLCHLVLPTSGNFSRKIFLCIMNSSTKTLFVVIHYDWGMFLRWAESKWGQRLLHGRPPCLGKELEPTVYKVTSLNLLNKTLILMGNVLLLIYWQILESFWKLNFSKPH